MVQCHTSLFLISLMPTVKGAKEKWEKSTMELLSQKQRLQLQDHFKIIGQQGF